MSIILVFWCLMINSHPNFIVTPIVKLNFMFVAKITLSQKLILRFNDIFIVNASFKDHYIPLQGRTMSSQDCHMLTTCINIRHIRSCKSLWLKLKQVIHFNKYWNKKLWSVNDDLPVDRGSKKMYELLL